jgi:hypothetical protein
MDVICFLARDTKQEGLLFLEALSLGWAFAFPLILWVVSEKTIFFVMGWGSVKLYFWGVGVSENNIWWGKEDKHNLGNGKQNLHQPPSNK